MGKNKYFISLLFLSTLFMNGCTYEHTFNKPVDLKIVGGYANDVSTDKQTIVGNKDDENSIIEPIKKLASTKLGKEITDFHIGEFIKYEENLFLNFSFKINKEQYYGVCQAYVKGNGWVIVETDLPPFSQLPVMYGTKGSYLYNQNQKNSVINVTDKRITIFSGYINDDRVRTIKLTFEDGQEHSINIQKGKNTYMYLSTGKEQKKLFTAYDKDGCLIYKQ